MNQKYLDNKILLANEALMTAKTNLASLTSLTLEELREIHGNLNRWVDFFSKAFVDGKILSSASRHKGLDKLLVEMKKLRLIAKNGFVALQKRSPTPA